MSVATSAVRVLVVTAGLSQPSTTRLLADRLATAVTSALDTRGLRAQVEVVELREWAHDLTNHLLTAFPSAGLRALLARVEAADVVVAVSPIFSASYSGLFKTFFDVVEQDALAGKPVLIAATGGSVRHSLALEHALRPLFAHLRATVVPTAVYAAPEDWASEGELTARIQRAAEEIGDLVESRKVLGPRSAPAERGPGRRSPAEETAGDVIPFARLLGAQHVARGS